VHLADLAAFEEPLLGFQKMRRGALLHAYLHHAGVLTDNGHERRPLLGPRGHGLFDVHVLTGPASVHGERDVVVVPGGDDDPVDILAVQQPAVVAVLLGPRARQFGGFAAPGAVRPTHRRPPPILYWDTG